MYRIALTNKVIYNDVVSHTQRHAHCVYIYAAVICSGIHLEHIQTKADLYMSSEESSIVVY